MFIKMALKVLKQRNRACTRCPENALAVLVPAGIGHGFLAIEDNTMQFFAIDKSGTDGHSKQLNYTEKKISLKLPILVTDISDYDLNAPFLD